MIDHVQKLEIILNKLKESEIKCNIEKSFFIQIEMGYLGFWVTRDGVKCAQIKNKSNIKYDATDLSKRSTSVYRFSKLLS